MVKHEKGAKHLLGAPAVPTRRPLLLFSPEHQITRAWPFLSLLFLLRFTATPVLPTFLPTFLPRRAALLKPSPASFLLSAASDSFSLLVSRLQMSNPSTPPPDARAGAIVYKSGCVSLFLFLCVCVCLYVKVGGGDGVEIACTHVTVSSSQLRASVRGAGTADKMRGGETDPKTQCREHSAPPRGSQARRSPHAGVWGGLCDMKEQQS